MTERNKYVVLSVAELEGRIRSGCRYEGLVDGIGYVYWRSQEIYFIQTNPKDVFSAPVYRQIETPYFQFDKVRSVETKVQYTLCVLSAKELQQKDRDMHNWYYYGEAAEVNSMKSAFISDATKVAQPVILIDIPYQQLNVSRTSAGRRMWNGFDTATDIADEFGMLPKPINRYLSIGKTMINVIDNVSRGKYYNAAGNIIGSFIDCNIGLYIDAGVMVYETDYMQKGIGRNAAEEFKYNVGMAKKYEEMGNRKMADSFWEKAKQNERQMKKAYDNINNAL